MIFAVYKPKGLTSHDVVNLVRKKTGEKTVGHAGTLDPLARGVLVIGVGREATKKLHELTAREKEYLAEIHLGVTSTTDDEEGEKKEMATAQVPAKSDITKILKAFEGEISQVPPPYSAIKIHGKPAYRYARQGKVLKLEPRRVLIKAIELISYEWPKLKLRVVTGPGVYIRSLARDIGAKLGIGGYLSDLERTKVGEYTVENSLKLDF